MQLDLVELRRIRRRFSSGLCHVDEADFYWRPEVKRLIYRSIFRKRDGKGTYPRSVPSDAVHIGRYARPFPPEAFMADLREAMR